MTKIRVLVVDDHPLIRFSLRTLLTTEAGLEYIGEAADGDEAIQKAFHLRPNVILMDLVMPKRSGIEAISEIKRLVPEISILVLTSFSDEDKVFPAIRAGALGYILKDASPQDLIRAIYDVHRGMPSLYPSIALQLLREIHQPTDEGSQIEHSLSDREVDVLRLIAQGLTNQEIANKLFISEWTVRTHVRNILTKLHLANRTQAALYALRKGLADLNE